MLENAAAFVTYCIASLHCYHCRSAMICRDHRELRWRLLTCENELSQISLLLYISTAFLYHCVLVCLTLFSVSIRYYCIIPSCSFSFSILFLYYFCKCYLYTFSVDLHCNALCFYGSIKSDSLNDGHGYTPHSTYSWLTAVMYNRRTKIDPLWNSVIVAGYYDNTP